VPSQALPGMAPTAPSTASLQHAAACMCSDAAQELALVAQLRMAAWAELMPLMPLACAWQHSEWVAACCNTIMAAICVSAGRWGPAQGQLLWPAASGCTHRLQCRAAGGIDPRMVSNNTMLRALVAASAV
jgi:hypothetical protein